MPTAELVTANLPQFCPVTNHYLCTGGEHDGQYLLVTVVSMDAPATLELFGIAIPISAVQLPTAVDVFLADEFATVLDSDGDPSNGMTPLASYEVDTHAAALAALGYELIEEGES